MRKISDVPLRRCLLSILAVLVSLGPAVSEAAADGQKQVLVLYSTRRDAQIAVIGDREMPRVLEAGLKNGVDYYSEHIDQARFRDPQYQQAFRSFLQLKYKGHRFDVIIAMNDVALEFLRTNRSRLFPDSPVVFLTTNRSTRRIANSTGVRAEQNFSGTVALALKLQPDTRQLFVVSGADDGDKAWAGQARAQLRQFEPRLTITYLSGLATADLEARLATLPEHSIVYYVLASRDGVGENFHPLRYVERVSAVASAPTYSWVDSAMDHGIVGGSLKNQGTQAATVARLALRVLRGERADRIPMPEVDLYVSQVDWRQLRRWGISEARVPEGTDILFRVPSLWDRYKVYILGAWALLLAQTALIAALLVQASRRRQAEEQVSGRQAELSASYERIRDLGGRLINAQEAERARIARDLHDDVGQQVALLAFDLDQLRGVGNGRPDDAARLARVISARAQTIGRSLHALSHRLHPKKLQLIGLVAALDGLQRDFSRPGLAITFSHDNVPAPLSHDLTLCLFRIAQEAVGNAAKHSAASEVAVRLSSNGEGLKLSIADDGVGFDIDTAWGRGLGLISMGERLEPFGGTLTIRSAPGAGARLEVMVPRQTASLTATVA